MKLRTTDNKNSSIDKLYERVAKSQAWLRSLLRLNIIKYIHKIVVMTLVVLWRLNVSFDHCV
jgi:hypothetical protein